MLGAKRTLQLELAFPNRHGGARKGAGRRPLPPSQRHTAHRSRGKHCRAHPVHVTLRSRSFKLREQAVIRTVLGALRASNRDWFRVAQYSVQANHIHLIVEAEDARSLSSSMRGLVVRIARRVNRLLGGFGRFWADRWHGVALTTPSQVRNVLVYVLQNWRKHAHNNAIRALDPCSPPPNGSMVSSERCPLAFVASGHRASHRRSRGCFVPVGEDSARFGNARRRARSDGSG